MKKLIEYDLVRRMYHRDNFGKRTISRQTGLHRETIKKMLEYPEPPGYRFKVPRPKPRLAPFVLLIDQILEDDRKAPRKQRHTAKRIFDRLRAEHGYKGGYSAPTPGLLCNSGQKQFQIPPAVF